MLATTRTGLGRRLAPFTSPVRSTVPGASAGRIGPLPSLTGLRFFAAFGVFGFHAYTQGLFADQRASRVVGTIFGQGAVGVSFFFILSGFVLTWSSRPETSPTQIWRRRAAKIIPNHVVTWLIALLGALWAGSHAISTGASMASLALVQAWVPDSDVYFAVNTPAWSLSCEAAFYVAFPLLLRLLSSIPASRLWPTAGILTTLILAIPFATLSLPQQLAYWFIYICPATRALEFMLGMTMARIIRLGGRTAIGFWPAIAMFAVLYVVSRLLPPGFGYVAATVIPLTLIVAAAAQRDIAGYRSALQRPSVVALGEASFAFYLLHQIAIRYMDKVLGAKEWSTTIAVTIEIGMLLVSVIGAWCLYRIVERPAMRMLTRRSASSDTPKGTSIHIDHEAVISKAKPG